MARSKWEMMAALINPCVILVSLLLSPLTSFVSFALALWDTTSLFCHLWEMIGLEELSSLFPLTKLPALPSCPSLPAPSPPCPPFVFIKFFILFLYFFVPYCPPRCSGRHFNSPLIFFAFCPGFLFLSIVAFFVILSLLLLTTPIATEFTLFSEIINFTYFSIFPFWESGDISLFWRAICDFFDATPFFIKMICLLNFYHKLFYFYI